jgi:nucleotide-binding universal stress UspA family protein
MLALQTINKITFKNILYLTDFTDSSQSALAYAMGLAKHFGARIFPAYACDPVILTETAAPDILDQAEDESRRRLLELASVNDLKGTPLFASSPVAVAVPGWINENGIDLIVMGTHGRKGLKHFFMGSVAEEIIRHATCPVLTVGPHVALRPYNEFKAEKVLFPTDLGSHAEFATHYALSVAQDCNAKVAFMHVVSPDESSTHGSVQPVKSSFNKLQALIPEEAEEWCTPELVVEVGDPATELLRYASAERPDLIVLGLPAGKKFNGHFHKSVTYNVVAGAPCPVLTVRDIHSDN